MRWFLSMARSGSSLRPTRLGLEAMTHKITKPETEIPTFLGENAKNKSTS